MRPSVSRVAARGVLVLVGVAVCLLGPARGASLGRAPLVNDRILVTAGMTIGAVDHAVAERPVASTGSDLSKFISGAQTAVVAGLLIFALAAFADRDRVVLAMVGVPWRR